MHRHYVEIVTLIDVRACVRSCMCKCVHACLGWMNVDRKQNWFCFAYFYYLSSISSLFSCRLKVKGNTVVWRLKHNLIKSGGWFNIHDVDTQMPQS